MDFDDDFRKACRTSVDVHAPSDNLAAHVLQVVSESGSEQGSGGAVPARAKAEAPRANWLSQRRIPLAAACAIAVVAVVLVVPAAQSALGTFSATDSQTLQDGTGAGKSAPAASGTSVPESMDASPGFTVKAHADQGRETTTGFHAEGEGALAQGNERAWENVAAADGSNVLFCTGKCGNGGETIWPEQDGSLTRAWFQPYVFTIGSASDAHSDEGHKIQRVRMRVSRGELYRQTVDCDADWRHKVGIADIDAHKRGDIEGYEGCDALSSYDTEGADEAGRHRVSENVLRLKRMGSTVDLTVDDGERVGTGEIQFGLLSLATTPAEKTAQLITQENGRNVLDKNLLDKPDDVIDGNRLTVTVTFENGQRETQVIDLHLMGVAADEDGTPLVPLRKLSDFSRSGNSVSVMWGALVGGNQDASNATFPYEDEQADECADAVMVPLPEDLDVL